jgi:hypothetical protein
MALELSLHCEGYSRIPAFGCGGRLGSHLLRYLRDQRDWMEEPERILDAEGSKDKTGFPPARE